MLRHAGGWVIQTTGVDATLRAVTGRDATDAFAAGEDGVVLRWDGTSWEALEAPADDYRAAATASGRPLWVASATRVRRWSESAGWSVAGPPWLQQIRALEATSSGRVAAVGDGGRVAVRAPEGAWTPRSTPVEASLRGVSLAADESELVAVGADGTVLVGPASGPMERVELQTDALLTDVVHRAGGGVLAVGEGGVLVRRDQAGWHVARIPDYRNRATAVFEVPDSGVVRVVGETGFRIGPFLDFPTVDGPAPAEGGSGVELAWSWDVGGEADYTSIEMRDAKGKGIWQLLVDGGRSEVQLPAFEGQPELTGLGEGPRAMRITRALVPGFDIDDYTVRDLGFFDRRTWSEREIEFQAP